MDPLTLAMSALTLAGTVLTIATRTNAYLTGVRAASEDVRTFCVELALLKDILARLKGSLDDGTLPPSRIGDDSVLVVSLHACKNQLEVMRVKLEAMVANRRRRLMWPFNREECVQNLEVIRNLARWLHFGLSVTGCEMISKNSETFQKMLTSQLKALQDLASVDRTLKDYVEGQEQVRDLSVIENLLNSLSSTNQNDRHAAIRETRIPDTGGWILTSKEFLEWCATPERSRIFWCVGIPGCGKSVLASHVIDHLQMEAPAPTHVVTFVYFDYQRADPHPARTLIVSLLRQVIRQLWPDILIACKHWLQKATQSHKLEPAELEENFLSVLSHVEKCYIVVDALDESGSPSERAELLTLLEKLAAIKSVRLFITSRLGIADIQLALQGAEEVRVEADRDDLKICLSTMIERSHSRHWIKTSDRDSTVEKIIERSHGMFLLPVLQLKQLLNEPSWGLMKRSLQNLPRDLPHTFHEYLLRLGDPSSSSRARLALKTLTWLTFARESLDPKRLQEALSIQPDSTGPDQDFVPSMSCILECCLGLVVVDEHAHIVRLVHFSLQEYLETHIHTRYPLGLEELALDCYTYCSYQGFSDSPCTNEADIVARLDQYRLLKYFASHWRYHTTACSNSPRVQAAVINFMSSEPHRTNLRQISRYVAGYREEYYGPEEAVSTKALHMLASLGHLLIFKQALDLNMDNINLQTGVVRSTPVLIAASAGHVEVTRYLLLHGADPSIPNWYGNALHCCAEANTADTITLLLDAGMPLNTRNTAGATPLACTTDHDAAEAAAILLSRGADPIDIKPNRYPNILFAAVQNHCPRLVSLIISRRCVDIDAEGGYFGLTALRTATLLLHVEIILLIAEATTDAAAADFSRRVAELAQRVPVGRRGRLGMQLWDIFERDGWETVEDKITSLLEDPEAATRIDDLSMEICKDGARDSDEAQVEYDGKRDDIDDMIHYKSHILERFRR